MASAEYLQDWFPRNIYHIPVLKYFEEREIINNNQIYHEYIYVLDFLEIAIQAHEINIRNYYENNTLITLFSNIKYGVLFIDEFSNGLYRKKTSFDVILELLYLSVCINTYNTLLNFWYENNEVMLRDILTFECVLSNIINEIRLDEDSEVNEIISLILGNDFP